MSHTKITERLVGILMKFNSQERFTIQDLTEEFGVSARTIQRDLNEKFRFLPIQKKGKYYFLESYALGKLSYKDLKGFATLCGIRSLYPDLSDSFLADLLNEKINKAYLIKNQEFEDISQNKDLFESLSVAITKNMPIKFFYKSKERQANPYKLLNNNGVWYLLADENNKLKTFTFSKIERFSVQNKKFFVPNKDFLQQIANNKTKWFSPQQTEVILQIKSQAQEYFLRKNILPNSVLIEKTKDYFSLSTKISYDDEILGLVKYWLPYIKIISPEYLSQKLQRQLENYLEEITASRV